jgi:CheY-like chemotaxis protein
VIDERILVVEDDADLRRLLENAFVGAGFDVVVAAHGAEALRLLRNGGVSAVVLDLVLPWVSGLEVLATMRSDEQLAPVPVVVVTATGMQTEDLRAFGPLTVVPKPFHAAAVIEAIGRLLGRPDLGSDAGLEP